MVIGKLGRAGAEFQLAELAAGLARQGDHVELAVLGEVQMAQGRLRAAGVKLVHLDAPPGPRRAVALPRLAAMARRSDIVHCTMWDASLWGRLAAAIARRPVVVGDHATDRGHQTSRSGAPRDRWIGLHNRLLDRFTFATVACARSQLPMLEREGVQPDRTVHIPNGVRVASFREAGHGRQAARGALGVPTGALLVVHLARFHPLKNQRLTLATVARLREELGDVHLLLVGDGAERADLERRAAGQRWAHFVGRRTDVPELLSTADLAVLPSLSEAMPLSLLEAMAAGLPVVATDVGDVGPTVRGADAGRCVPAGDDEAFYLACRELLMDPTLREQLGSNAAGASRAYDLEAMVDRYSELFDSALTGSPSR